MPKTATTWLLALLMTVAAPHVARAAEPAEISAVEIDLKDGSQLVGTLIAEDGETLTLRLTGGSELHLLRADVVAVVPRSGPKRLARADPNNTRLLFAPTGRPLPKGEGYFSDHYVLFPGFAYGVTDNFSIGAGISTIPGLSIERQLFYASPRLAFQAGPKRAFAVGLFYADTALEEGDDRAIAMGYGVATFGGPARSLSLGLGYGATRRTRYEYLGDGDFREQTRWARHGAPIVMLGGNVQLSERVGLVSENWLHLGDGFELSEQPFALALRLCGKRLSADVGVVLIPELVDEGYPIPWLSITYRLGPAKGRGAEAALRDDPRPRVRR